MSTRQFTSPLTSSRPLDSMRHAADHSARDLFLRGRTAMALFAEWWDRGLEQRLLQQSAKLQQSFEIVKGGKALSSLAPLAPQEEPEVEHSNCQR